MPSREELGLPKKDQDTIITEKPIPVLIGIDYEHIMAKAVIVQKAAITTTDDHGRRVVLKAPSVEITIEGQGDLAEWLGGYVAANEIVSLSFAGVPVRPRPHKETD